MGLATTLCEQAKRCVRTRWGQRTDMFAEEVFVILSQACEEETGPISFLPPDGPAIFLPPQATNPPFDPGPPSTVVIPTPTQTPSGETQEVVTSEVQWHRECIPGYVRGLSGGYFYYDVLLFPRGFLSGEGGEAAEVLQLQIDPSAVIPESTWTLVSRIVQVEYRKTVVSRIADGAIVSIRTDVFVLSEQNFMQVPVWL